MCECMSDLNLTYMYILHETWNSKIQTSNNLAYAMYAYGNRNFINGQPVNVNWFASLIIDNCLVYVSTCIHTKLYSVHCTITLHYTPCTLDFKQGFSYATSPCLFIRLRVLNFQSLQRVL